MATSATIRRSEPQRVAPTITWPRTVALLDSDGAFLTDVDVPGPACGGRLLLGDVNEPSALLDYYFGHGGRQVMLSLDDAPIAGWLETCWGGSGRSWWLDLTE